MRLYKVDASLPVMLMIPVISVTVVSFISGIMPEIPVMTRVIIGESACRIIRTIVGIISER